jgi:serine phosphatase RsbU (regulator of sigma subunit)
VPGAMVSVVCHNALNRAVREFKITQPSKILDKTRELIIETFSSSEKNVSDGMDISICCWNQTDNTLEWAGANNPLYVIRKDEEQISITPPDKQPVGKFGTLNDFINHHLQLFSGDLLFLFSDGFQDQFGGENGKKYKRSNFKKFLISIKDETMSKQKSLIEIEFNTWKGKLEQLDDVCVIGVRID